MRVLFLTASGHAYADKVGLNYDNIQEPDGIHPLTNDAIYTDDQKREAITFIAARHTVPVGEDRSLNKMREIVFERTLMIVARRGHRVSRIWSRRLVNFICLLLRGFYFGWLVGLIMLGVYIVVRLVTL